MKRLAPLITAVGIAVCGCNPAPNSAGPNASGLRATDLVGKWRLVHADGKTPAESSLKSQELDLAADGTWTSTIEMGGELAGMTLKGGGTWSIAPDGVYYTNGTDKGTSHASLNSGRLVLDPDFHLRKNDAAKSPITCEYER